MNVARLGGLHVLVNHAGITMFTPIDELTVEDFDLMAINLRGTFLL